MGVPRILVAGAGIGGLALAQALHHGGLDVTVFERDPTPTIRDQGYRLHIDPDGNAALRDCLPAPALAEVHRTSGVNGDLVASYTQRLEQVMAQTFPDVSGADVTHVDRNAFRQGLLTGLGDRVRFGRAVSGYSVTGSGRVRVEFAGGGGEEGDVLVGADGAGSAVRRRLLPHAALRDVGLRCLYGRMTIDDTTAALVPDDFARGFCWVGGDRGEGAGFAPVFFRERPAGARDYLMVAFVAGVARLGVPDQRLFALPAADLWRLAAGICADWHPALRALVAHADPGSFFPITIRASEPVGPWRPGPVTLLGDAVHTMPPAGGVGANTALQDAATLAAELIAAARGERSLAEAVGRYERVMLPRGFATIDRSLAMIGQMLGSPS
ncbi:NAD(P)/FAD-dependent oxidoreductase [Actinoplanes sp. NPDC023936]|uniref:FAD-dependent oxidoreductase n=1 Tax=Actinoplanes sp. NPDC023936 TaxID=3154910 RepID=UPI0033DCE5A7